MYKTLDLKNRQTIKAGAHGSYFKLSPRRGVKVYGLSSWAENGFVCSTDVCFHEVENDFKFIRSLRCRIVPKAYSIVLVFVGGLWYPGIIMEHVEGVHLDKLVPGKGMLKNLHSEQLMINIENEFTKLTGYIHQDLHGMNVLFQRKTKTYKVIDISLEYASRSVKQAA